MSEYFTKLKFLGGKVKVQLDLSNKVTKTDLENTTRVNASKFVKTDDLANLKSNVDKLDIDKLKNVPPYLSNLKNKVDKLDVDKLVPVPADLKKLSDVVKNDVSKKGEYNTKIKIIENEIRGFTNLAT